MLSSHHFRLIGSKCSLSLSYRSLSVLRPTVTLPNGNKVNTLIQAPSEKTTVLLKRLPPSVTQSSLNNIIKPVSESIRKVELQPGFVVHVRNSAAALCLSSILNDKFSCKSRVESTSMPSILLKGVPETVDSFALKDAFSAFDPKAVNITGTSMLQIAVESAAEAIMAVDIIESIELNHRSLETNVIELSNDNFIIQVTNLAKGAREEAEQLIASKMPAEFPHKFIHSKNSNSVSISLHNSVNANSFKSALERINGKNLVVSDPLPLKYPALFVRNTHKVSEGQLRALLEQHNPEQISFTNRSEHVLNDLVVVYFNHEEDAYRALRALRATTFEGKRLPVTFREITKPQLIITNPPENMKESYINDKLKGVPILDIKTQKFSISSSTGGSVAGKRVSILFASQHALELAETILKPFEQILERGGYRPFQGLTVQLPAEVELDDSSFLKKVKDSIPQEIEGVKITAQLISLSVNSNRNAFVSFLDSETAKAAHRAYMTGKIPITHDSSSSSSKVPFVSKLSFQPTSALEVVDFSPETSLSEALATLDSGNKSTFSLSKHILATDRLAVVKFKRHMHVVQGMKQLKSVQIDNEKISVERYHSTSTEPETEYDRKGAEDEFDRLALRGLLTDSLFADPASRYQLAKNIFERTLADVKTGKDLRDKASYLLTENANPALKATATKILSKDNLNADDKTRLFELFLQRDDMFKFLSDYEELVAVYGKPDESDPFDWSNFSLQDQEDLTKLKAALNKREADLEKNPHLMRDTKTSTVNQYLKDQDYDVHDNDTSPVYATEARRSKSKNKYEIVNADGSSEKMTLDPNELVDRDGRAWSGIILDTDVVKKTLPGGRVISNRALVMIGNLRGTGGFGKGKGASAEKAIEAAFRDALNNLIFIDLYENGGLAHDVIGKHNGCFVYIRGTPISRVMVASPLIEEILTRFGIGSASVRTFGNRNPYSVIRAIFNALQKHENLDEFAKARGQRYLTLKWMYKNNI